MKFGEIKFYVNRNILRTYFVPGPMIGNRNCITKVILEEVECGARRICMGGRDKENSLRGLVYHGFDNMIIITFY